MNKKTLNEAGICDNYVTPAITGAGWDAHTQVRREYGFTAGRIIVQGKLAVRGERKQADYLLFYQPNLPLRCRLHDHPSGLQGSGERSGARTIGTKGELGMHGGRNDDLPVEAPEQVEVPDSRQGDEGSRIRDDRPGHEAVPTSSSNSSAG